MIHKVERIQNALLHYRYSQGKARFTSLCENPEEIAVFHGTAISIPGKYIRVEKVWTFDSPVMGCGEGQLIFAMIYGWQILTRIHNLVVT